jgi:DNA-binding NarL/FixJ family response regulator
VLVDSHPIVVAGMTKIFSGDTRYRIVGTSTSLNEAKSVSAEERADLLITDIRSTSANLMHIIDTIREHIAQKIIVFTDSLNADVGMQVIKAGISGIIFKDAGADEVLEAAWNVYHGELYIAHRFAGELLRRALPQDRPDKGGDPNGLKLREQQIIELVCEAKSNREIAAAMSLSEKTVKRYMTILMQKMNVRNRVQLAIYAQKHMRRG